MAGKRVGSEMACGAGLAYLPVYMFRQVCMTASAGTRSFELLMRAHFTSFTLRFFSGEPGK
ncbi:hypothetical protein GGI07_002717 [Coemansia sp. Benny D115]|nr:hypothetical protein GGI07_002717 [Coemansia sp. Benny D115]